MSDIMQIEHTAQFLTSVKQYVLFIFITEEQAY